jgi:hypothetical protein
MQPANTWATCTIPDLVHISQSPQFTTPSPRAGLGAPIDHNLHSQSCHRRKSFRRGSTSITATLRAPEPYHPKKSGCGKMFIYALGLPTQSRRARENYRAKGPVLRVRFHVLALRVFIASRLRAILAPMPVSVIAVTVLVPANVHIVKSHAQNPRASLFSRYAFCCPNVKHWARLTQQRAECTQIFRTCRMSPYPSCPSMASERVSEARRITRCWWSPCHLIGLRCRPRTHTHTGTGRSRGHPY